MKDTYIVDIHPEVAAALRDLHKTVGDYSFVDKVIAIVIWSLCDEDMDSGYYFLTELVQDYFGDIGQYSTKLDVEEHGFVTSDNQFNTTVLNGLMLLADGFYTLYNSMELDWVDVIRNSGRLEHASSVHVKADDRFYFMEVSV